MEGERGEEWLLVGYVFSLCVIAASGRFVSQSGGRHQAGRHQAVRQAGRQKTPFTSTPSPTTPIYAAAAAAGKSVRNSAIFNAAERRRERRREGGLREVILRWAGAKARHFGCGRSKIASISSLSFLF